MRHITIIILVFCTLCSTSHAEEMDSLLFHKPQTEVDYYCGQEASQYTTIASQLTQWNYADWSRITFDYNQQTGDFKNVDGYSYQNLLSVKTDAIKTFKKSGLRFYGTFSYNQGNYEDSDWNLFFKHSEVGSPFRLVTERNGEWNSKHYGISGLMAKDINHKLTLGVGVEYYGDLYLRIRDTRNEQFNLNVKYQLSATYSLNKNRSLSFGLNYNKRKSEPTLSNKFPVTGIDYTVYSSVALSDFESQENVNTLQITDQNPEFHIAYTKGIDKRLDLRYTFYPGNEMWRYNITSTNSSIEPEIYNYKYQCHKFVYNLRSDRTHYIWHHNAEVDFVNGNGLKNRSGNFQDIYTYTGANAHLKTTNINHQRRFFNHNSVALNIDYSKKRDLIYAPKMNWLNAQIVGSTGCWLFENTKHSANLNIEAGYRHNITNNYELGAAKAKKYTTNIGYNELAYNTANILHYKAAVTYRTTVNAILIDCQLFTQNTTAIKIHTDSSYNTVLPNSNMLYTGGAIKFLF